MDNDRDSLLGWLLVRLKSLWASLIDFGEILLRYRFSVLMLLAGLQFLLWTPQGQDVLRNLVRAFWGRTKPTPCLSIRKIPKLQISGAVGRFSPLKTPP